MNVRYIKILLLLPVAVLGLIAFFTNISTLQLNFETVQSILSMQKTFDWPNIKWRAITNPYLVGIGYGSIILCELAVGVLCASGAVNMWRARRAEARAFNDAKLLAQLGCAIGILLWYGGFIVVAGEWFFMWQHGAATLEHAFRFAGGIALILIIVSLKDE